MKAAVAFLFAVLLIILGTQVWAQTPQPVEGTGGAPPKQGQQAPPGDQDQNGQGAGIIRIQPTLVVVPVTVKDAKGNIVAGLQKKDFRIFQDGVEQPIAEFLSEAFPLSAVVLVDNALSIRPEAQVQQSLDTISAGFGPNDEAALMIYDEFPVLLMDFTFNNDAFFTKLQRVKLGYTYPGTDQGPMTAGPMINNQSQLPGVNLPPEIDRSQPVTACMDDALFASAQILQTRRPDRRNIVLLISDGTNCRRNQHSFPQVIELLLKGNVSVYTVSVGNAFLKHESSRLLNYSKATGGDSYYARKAEDLEHVYSNLTEEARSEYTLAFAPKNTNTPYDFHSIEVRVERPKLKVTARQGFYAGLPH